MATGVKMFRGAATACVLPIMLGLVGVILSGEEAYISIRDGFFFASSASFILPVAICFAFGTPMAAWLACRRLRRIDDHKRLGKWRSSAKSGILAASFVHAVAAILFTALFFAASRDVLVLGGDIAGVFFIIGVIHAALWVGLTLPFSLLCATIFWRVTDFPEDSSVF